MPLKDWSTVTADNDDADIAAGLDFRENWNPNQVNNSMRALMTSVKTWWDQIDGGSYSGGTVGGTGNAHTLTFASTVQTLQAGMRFIYLAPGAATGAVTLNVDGQGAKALQWMGSALVSGDINSGDLVAVYYDGTQFQLVIPPRVTATYTAPLTSMNSFATDTPVTGDFIPFVDVSEPNANNKVTIDNLINMALGLVTTLTSIDTGDLVIFADASASNAGKKITIENFLGTAMQLLTTDSGNAGPGGDKVAYVDVSASNVAKLTTLTSLFYGFIVNSTQSTAPDKDNANVLLADTALVNNRRALVKHLGIGKQTIWVPAGALVPRTTNGPSSATLESTTNKVMRKVLDFDAATDEFAQAYVQMPKSWDRSTVTFIFVWEATNTGNVVWGAQGLALSDDDVIDTAYGTAVTVTDGVTATTDVMRSAESGACTIGNTPAAQDMVSFQIYRDADNASDTCAVDARLHGVVILYNTEVNTDT